MKCVYLILVCLLLTACSSPQVNPAVDFTQTPTGQIVVPRPTTQASTQTPVPAKSQTPTASQAPSQTPASTQAPLPTSTIAPTYTPSPSGPLSDQGPWLVYLAETNGSSQLVAMNPDATGYTELGIFPGFDVATWGSVTSSWFAVELLDQNLGESTVTLYQMPGGEAKFRISQSFGFGVQASWSPGGRYLALTAQIDSPSTDLYIYDTQDGSLSRLTSGSLYAFNPKWSPYGTWIIQQEVKMLPGGGASLVTAVYAISPSDQEIQLLYEPNSVDEQVLGWMTADTFAVYSLLEGGSLAGNARLVNVNTRQVTPLYTGNFTPYSGALDPTSGVFAFSINPELEEIASRPAGIYLQYPGGGAQKVAEWGTALWDQHVGRFIVQTNNGEVLGITPKGVVTSFGTALGQVDGAPNGQWLAFYGESGGGSPPGIRLYTPVGDLLRAVTTEGVHELLWRPDSAGLFFTTDTGLYYLEIPDGQPVHVDERKTHNLSWVGGSP